MIIFNIIYHYIQKKLSWQPTEDMNKDQDMPVTAQQTHLQKDFLLLYKNMKNHITDAKGKCSNTHKQLLVKSSPKPHHFFLDY